MARWQAFAEAARAYANLAPIGECVVRADPAGSLALLKTKVESDAEKAAVGAIASALPGCVKKGEQWSSPLAGAAVSCCAGTGIRLAN